MQGHSDEWIENRIRWNLEKHGLPGGHTHYFEEMLANMPDTMKHVAIQRSIGRPIAAVVEQDRRWLVIGTNGLFWCNGEIDEGLLLDDIKSIKAWNPGAASKATCDCLLATDRQGHGHNIPVPIGSEAYSLLNLLLNLIKLQKNE